MKISICFLMIFLSGCFRQTSQPVTPQPTTENGPPTEPSESVPPKPKPPKPRPPRPKPPENPAAPVDDSAKYQKNIEKILDADKKAETGRINSARELSKEIIGLVSKKPEILSTAFGQSKKTLVEQIATMPIVDGSIDAINFIKSKSTPEAFLFQLGGGDANNLINELLRPKRSDDNSVEMKKLFGIIVQTFRENNKDFPIEPAKAIAILDLIKDEQNNLKFIFDEVVNNRALRPQLFQWVGANVDHPFVRSEFARVYKGFTEDEKLPARSNVLLGTKNTVGNASFVAEIKKYAKNLGLDSIDSLSFGVSGIATGGNKTLSELSAMGVNILPTEQALTFEDLAKKSREEVKAQALIVESETPDSKFNGLVNHTGNSCFLNAITQTLLHTREINQLLTYYIKNNGLPFFKAPKREFPLVESLAKLANEYRSSDGAVRPEDWTKLAMEKTVVVDCQHDANDFYTQLYDKMDKELNVVSSAPKKYDLKDFERRDIKFVRNYLQSYGASILNKWLMGFEQINLTYVGDKKSVSYDVITGLDLSFPEGKNDPVKLEDFFDEYAKEGPPEFADNIKNKKVTLVVAPKILRITLKRFRFDPSTGTTKKINDPVEYPAVLKITANKAEKVYDLYSVVLHLGEYGGGHYMAIVKSEKGQWYLANDSSIEKYTEAEALSANKGQVNARSQAYMLFYRMR